MLAPSKSYPDFISILERTLISAVWLPNTADMISKVSINVPRIQASVLPRDRKEWRRPAKWALFRFSQKSSLTSGQNLIRILQYNMYERAPVLNGRHSFAWRSFWPTHPPITGTKYIWGYKFDVWRLQWCPCINPFFDSTAVVLSVLSCTILIQVCGLTAEQP